MQGGALTVISCFFDQPITAATPVNLEQPEEADELLQIAAEALAEIDDLKVQLLLMRNPQPARAIVQEPQKEKIDFLCAGMNSGLPKESQVNRLVLRLLRFAPCNMFVLDPRDADGSRYENILLPMEVGSYFGKY